MIVQWLGWLSVLLFIFALGSYLARKSTSQKVKHFFRGKHHRMWGKLLLAVSILHGITASICYVAKGLSSSYLLITLSGSFCVFVFTLLLMTYVKRTKLKQNWFQLHKKAAMITVFAVILHILLSFLLRK